MNWLFTHFKRQVGPWEEDRFFLGLCLTSHEPRLLQAKLQTVLSVFYEVSPSPGHYQCTVSNCSLQCTMGAVVNTHRHIIFSCSSFSFMIHWLQVCGSAPTVSHQHQMCWKVTRLSLPGTRGTWNIVTVATLQLGTCLVCLYPVLCN